MIQRNLNRWWMGVLHLPLLIISFYVFVMAGKELKQDYCKKEG